MSMLSPTEGKISATDRGYPTLTPDVGGGSNQKSGGESKDFQITTNQTEIYFHKLGTHFSNNNIIGCIMTFDDN